MKINLSFDVENIYGERSDSVLYELCQFCTKYRIPVDLYITGMKYEYLQKRSPQVIHLIRNSDHLHLQYHTNTHSIFPLPLVCNSDTRNISEIEERRYDHKNDRFVDEGGILSIKQEFELVGFRAPNFAWDPRYLTYIRDQGLQVHSMVINYPRAFEWKKMIHLPTLERPLESFNTPEEVLKCISDFDLVSLMLHPSQLVYNEFWDRQPNQSLRQDRRKIINRMKRILRSLSKDHVIVSACQLPSLLSPVSETEDLSSKLVQSIVGQWGWSQLPPNFHDDESLRECKKDGTVTPLAT